MDENNVIWFYTSKNEFPPIGLRVITSNNHIGYFNGNYIFINEIPGENSNDEIIWTYLPVFKKYENKN